MLKKFAFLILICHVTWSAMSQDNEQEANLKAVFIYNFTKYVDWEMNNNNPDFIIGVIGSSPVLKPLEEIARTNRAKNKRIIIRYYRRPEEIGPCHLLFISKKCPFSIQEILNHTRRGVLTVSEEDDYSKKGTAFNFVIRNDKLKFEANLQAIYMAGLRASSQLLKLAIIVD